jgi:HlyD family secretion protein
MPQSDPNQSAPAASSPGGDRWRHQPRSEAVSEILGTPPNWLLQWGNVLLLISLVITFVVAYNYRYPDVVSSKLTLTTIEPARRLNAPRNLTVDRILVNTEDSVVAGRTLMVFKSPAKFEHVQFLQNTLLEGERVPTDSTLAALDIPNSLILGEIQEDLYQFTERQEAYLVARDRRLSGLSDQELNRRIRQEEAALRSEKGVRDQLMKEVGLSARALIRQQNLLDNDIIERAEFEKVAEVDLRTRRLLSASESRIRDLSFNIELLDNQKDKYRTGEQTVLQQAARDLRESHNLLSRAVERWKQKHLLVAPKDGIILVNIDVREQQLFSEGQELATLLPLNPQGVLGRINLPLKGSGKVAVGDRVIIKFLNYPSEEFGSVQGVVTSKSPIPSGDVIPILVGLPDGMVTNTGNRLDPVQFMRADAEIIVGEKRLLAWLFDRE